MCRFSANAIARRRVLHRSGSVAKCCHSTRSSASVSTVSSGEGAVVSGSTSRTSAWLAVDERGHARGVTVPERPEGVGRADREAVGTGIRVHHRSSSMARSTTSVSLATRERVSLRKDGSHMRWAMSPAHAGAANELPLQMP